VPSSWRREGECSRCGDCCRGDFTDPHSTPDVPCPLLRRDAAGVAACAGWGEHPYYLSGCNVWPSKPEHIADMPRCTYRFVKVA
jgi:hypothetical protein